MLALKAKVVELTAGLLVTPVLLLNPVPARARADQPSVRSVNWAKE